MLTGKKTRMRFEVDAEDLVDAVMDFDGETIKEFIMAIDRYVADYDFTKELLEYFKEEIRKEDEADEQGL